MKYWFLRLHRWLALAFALPLLVVLATAIVLSVEPGVVTSAIKPGSLTAERLMALLAKHDPDGKERAVAHRGYDGTLSLGGRGAAKVIDVATGDLRPGPSGLAALFATSRRLHETLLLDLGWVVLWSSYAMLVLGLLGVLMGWPRFANTVSGWHKGMAFGLLPLLVLSPLTGIFLAQGITFTSSGGPGGGERQQARPAEPLKLADAVRIVGAKHDLAGLVWLRPRGDRMLVRLVEGGEYKVYAVTREGTRPQPRNWVRLLHEGNFAGVWSALLNFVTALAAFGLLVTGAWIWARRKLRPRPARARAGAAAV